MNWLNYLILTQYDPEKHNGFPGHRLNPFKLPDHADPAPADIPNVFFFFGTNAVGNYFMAAVFVAVFLFIGFANTKAAPFFAFLVFAIVGVAMYVSSTRMYGYF